MVIRDYIYETRDDDKDLADELEIMKNVRNLFENCQFTKISAKNFNNCQFINCTFGDVGSSVFTNCQFDNPKFYDGFRGSFVKCSISEYTGRVGERRQQ